MFHRSHSPAGHDSTASPRRPRVLLVGNLCHDFITLKSGRTVEALGGSVAYISRVLDAVGVSSKSVAKVGSDFKYWDALGPNCRPVVVGGGEPGRKGSTEVLEPVAAKTTEFFADFTGSDRVLTAGHLCEPITASDLPSFSCSCPCPCGCQIAERSLADVHRSSTAKTSILPGAPFAAVPAAGCDTKRCDVRRPGGCCSGESSSHLPIFDVGMAAGVAGEVQASTVRHIAEISRHTVADLQSMVREIDPVTGAVDLRHLEKTSFMALLPRISYLKVASHEASFLDIQKCARLLGTDQTRSTLEHRNGCGDGGVLGGAVLLTQAEKGCTVITRDREFVVPSFPAVELDSTGAGDSFMAGFITGLCLNRSLEEAVRMGSFFGSVAVEKIGVPKITPEIVAAWQAEFHVTETEQ